MSECMNLPVFLGVFFGCVSEKLISVSERDSLTVHQSALSGLKRLKSCLSSAVRILKSISLPFSLHLEWIGFFFFSPSPPLQPNCNLKKRLV